MLIILYEFERKTTELAGCKSWQGPGRERRKREKVTPSRLQCKKAGVFSDGALQAAVRKGRGRLQRNGSLKASAEIFKNIKRRRGGADKIHQQSTCRSLKT